VGCTNEDLFNRGMRKSGLKCLGTRTLGLEGTVLWFRGDVSCVYDCFNVTCMQGDDDQRGYVDSQGGT
jgi:hypothetical protein